MPNDWRGDYHRAQNLGSIATEEAAVHAARYCGGWDLTEQRLE
jgi:hypothetical protein